MEHISILGASVGGAAWRGVGEGVCDWALVPLRVVCS